MSNYPPGVDIAHHHFGPDYEETERRDCGAETALRVQPVDPPFFDPAHGPPTVETVCPYSGPVTVAGGPDGLEWTCPLCGTTHFEEP